MGVGPDQDVADVPAAVARWRADTWRSGTVLLGGQLGSADDGWAMEDDARPTPAATGHQRGARTGPN